MKYMLFFALALFLVLGCVEGGAEQPLENVSEIPEKNETMMTCEEYCKSLPHILCVGHWNISGTYPDCKCEFICEVADEETEEIVEEPEQNETEEPEAETTNKTLDELMEEKLAKIRSDFYRENSGSFQVNKYTWKRLPGNASPGDITFDKAPASEVTFDDTAIESIQASGFMVFTNTGTDETNAYGFAIFNELNTMLDTYTGTDAFDVWYFPKIIDKDLKDCWVYEKKIKKNEKGWVTTYLFECEKVYDK